MNLLSLAKKFSKGYPPQRNVEFLKHVKKQVRRKEPDFSKFLSKSSATSLIKKAITKNCNPNMEKRCEIQLAAEQMRKCNEILRNHYLQKRNLHRSHMQQLPILSKLKSLIAQDSKSSFKSDPKVNDIKRSNWTAVKRNSIDFKPQKYGNPNRWHMKIPFRKPQAKTRPSKRGRRAVKNIKPPKVQVLNCKSSNEKNYQKLSLIGNRAIKKIGFWQIGKLSIPRLD